MNPGKFQLLTQLGAGRDGVAYRAQMPESGAPIELRVLVRSAADPFRWRWLSRRLQLAALLDRPAARRILQLALEQAPPFVALEWLDGRSLAETLTAPLGATEVVARVTELVAALAAAHRLGLTHGRLVPSQVFVAASGSWKLDFTGTETRSASDAERFAQLDRSCRPPEFAGADSADSASDLYELGALSFCCLTGQPWDSAAGVEELRKCSDVPEPLVQLVAGMLATDPVKRLWATEVEDQLRTFAQPPVSTAPSLGISDAFPIPPVEHAYSSRAEQGKNRLEEQLASPAVPAVPGRLGRFRLLEKVGEGGMGAVFRAEDPVDGATVALKVIRPDRANNPQALRRFYKEARLLAEVDNPHVTRLLEINEDQGTHYLVLEYVAGRTLFRLLEERQRLDERTAVGIVADVARGLADAHQRGIVHRDIKPENILLVEEHADDGTRFRVKLTDFGLARHIVQSESLNITRAGTVLGTPLYMSPEQCAGQAIDPRTDVYALGVTLFHMLAGRPPFVGTDSLAVLAMHRFDPVPDLTSFNAAASADVRRVVEKALAKAPEARYANAAALLRDLEALLHVEPAGFDLHPRLPPCPDEQLLSYDFTWELDASPQALWPHVANTERLNRAIGLPAVQFTDRPSDDHSVERSGSFSIDFSSPLAKGGQGEVVVAWHEHPFEWVEAQRMGVLREYERGPYRWLASVVELAERLGGGTRLTHRIRIEPRDLMGRTLAAVEIGTRARQALERVYRRIDFSLAARARGETSWLDPFEEPAALSSAQGDRLQLLLERLAERGLPTAAVRGLGDFLKHAPAQEVARIRPITLARRLGLEPAPLVDACLHAAREGLLILVWDILCPACRGPAELHDTLRAIQQHSHCNACNLDFELDLAGSIELVFRAHPQVRESELKTYCIGGPWHAPHVAAQVRLAPGERLDLELALLEGAYRLRASPLCQAHDFRVQSATHTERWEVPLDRPASDELRSLKPGRQVLSLANEQKREVLVRIERSVPREDVLPAARAIALPLFQTLFPAEVLSPSRLVGLASATFLATQVDQADRLFRDKGDAGACALLHEHYRLLEDIVVRAGGTLFQAVDDGAVAVFAEPAAAVRAALEISPALARQPSTRMLGLRIAVHRGPAMVATLNGRLDYFGATVRLVRQLPRMVRVGEMALTPEVAGDPPVADLLARRGIESEVFAANFPDQPTLLLQRIVAATPARV